MCANLKHMGRKLLKTVQTITTFRNPLADPVGTRRGPPLVRGPQFENRWFMLYFESNQGRQNAPFRSLIFKIFFASGGKRALSPLTKILRTFLIGRILLCDAD